MMVDEGRYEGTRGWKEVAPCSRAVLGRMEYLGG